MTIVDHEQLARALQQQLRLYKSLRSLRERVENVNAGNFAVLAEGPLNMLQQIQREIDEYSGVLAAQELSVALWVRVRGPEIVDEIRRFSIMEGVLRQIRKSIEVLAEPLLAALGIAVEKIREQMPRASDLDVVIVKGGSLLIGVRLLPQEHLAMEVAPNQVCAAAQKSLEDLAKTAVLASTPDRMHEMHALVPDETRRRLLLAEVADLAPTREGGIDCIELSGHILAGVGEARLQRDVRQRIRATFEREVETSAEHYQGDVREMDLDRRTFKLKATGSPDYILCSFTSDLKSKAEKAFNRHVRVVGDRRTEHELRDRVARKLSVTKLEILGPARE